MVQSRIRVLDAGRGTAMLFVFLSHFVEYYLTSNGKMGQLYFLYRFTQIASPTFMLISGITLGYLFSMKKDSFGPTRRKFIDRGLFLITIAHILIFVSWLPFIKASNGSMRVLFITDTIGFCLIAGTLLVSIVKPRGRIVLSIVLYSTSWLIISLGNLNNPYLKIIADTFFGSNSSSYFDIFPIFPWFSLYFLGTAIGEKVSLYQHKGLQKNITTLFLRIGFFSIVFAVAIIFIFKLLKVYGISFSNETLNVFISKNQKNPPGLVYYLLYGGGGLIMLSILNKIIENQRFVSIIDNLEIVGKTSLFAFVLQYFIYFSIIVWIKPHYMKIWPLFFFLTLAFNILIIRFWFKKGLNKYITVLNLSVWKTLLIKDKSLNKEL